MAFRYLYIGIFLLISSSLFCQKNYSEEEMKDFVHVYMTFKNVNKRNANNDKLLFEQYGMTQQRYREIAKSALTNNAVQLSENEKNLFEHIEKENKLEKERKEKLLSELCKEKGIAKSTFQLILEQYKQDVKFQRSLKPYFDNYIKSLK